MSGGRRLPTRVRHPILRLEVVDGEGRRSYGYRVFCRLQQRSIAVGVCAACVHCDEIAATPSPSVNCTVDLEESKARPDPNGVATAVGSVLQEGPIVLVTDASVRDAIDQFHASGRHAIGVVASDKTMVGVVHEAALAARGFVVKQATVRQLMSASLSIHESVPLRRALEILAGAHLREAIVVDDAGVPLGVFRDLDGLRWLVLQRR